MLTIEFVHATYIVRSAMTLKTVMTEQHTPDSFQIRLRGLENVKSSDAVRHTVSFRMV